MSEENKIIEESKEWETENSNNIWVLLIMLLIFGGWGNPENPKISELEKKVARLEGQMSMLGGK